jgi:hypothetical protein
MVILLIAPCFAEEGIKIEKIPYGGWEIAFV